MNVLAVGYAGEGNAGDDYLALRLTELVEEAIPEASVTIAWGGSSLWSSPVARVVGRDLPSVLNAVQSCDALIIGPGGILHNARGFGNWHHDRSLAFFDEVTASAHERGISISAVGIGVGPLGGGGARRLTKRILSRCSAISVRDHYSADWLERLGVSDVRIVSDLTIARTASASLTTVPRPARVGVCLRPWIDSQTSIQLARKVASAINTLSTSGYVSEVVGLPLSLSNLHELDDRWITQIVLDAMTGTTTTSMAEGGTLGTVVDGFSNVDVVISMRLHGTIFAANAGAAVLGIGYDPKVRAATDELGVTVVEIDTPSEELSRVLRSVLAAKTTAPDVGPGHRDRPSLEHLASRVTPGSDRFGGLRRSFDSLLTAAGL